MTISKDLLLAILSMDSYNRGYGAGLSDGQNVVNGVDVDGLGEAGSVIGSASVKAIDLPAGSQDAGFYAIAYKLDAAVGEGADRLAKDTTIISYRGTDNFSTDAVSGYSIELR